MTINNDVNSVTLIGSVYKEPVIRFMPSGLAASRLILTTTCTRQFKGENSKKITFHTILAYGECAEGIRYTINNNSRVKVEGSINNRKWKDPKTNTERYITEIIATSIKAIDNGKKISECTPEEYVAARLDTKIESNSDLLDDLDVPF